MTDPLKDLFHQEEESPMVVDLPALLQRTHTFQRSIRRRNHLEVFAAGLVVAFFGRSALVAPDLLHALGPLSVALGAVFIAWKLATRGEAPTPEPASTTADFVQSHRDALLYQADLLGSAPRWYLGPIVPGIVWIYALDLYETTDTTLFWARLAVFAGSMLVVAWVGWINLRGAQKLRAEAAELPVVNEGPTA